MKTLFALALMLSLPALALDKVCYEKAEGGQFCTTDNVGKVQVYLYNAGWCPPCNSEMAEMPSVAQEFDGQDVVFASLSGEGWSHGAKPDSKFLKAWKARHQIPFTVAGKFRDFGAPFSPPGFIPFTVILDRDGNVAKSGGMETSEIASEVRALLAH